ncbi:MAG: glycogen/starch/alpha-glucan phosphorylase [Clostridia bacterium]|nr:glycogen/starch/alpha-glucan phosphorylase [Clostridia bacterium]
MIVKRLTVDEIKASIKGKLERNYGCEISDATKAQIYDALAQTVRDEVMKRRTASRGERKKQHCKKLYYLSAEFLVGRALHNNMVALVNEEAYAVALHELGLDPSKIFEEEPEPGLGNGGLGRLAACFLDSLSSLRLPAMGCTIRYEYGLFRQKIVDGYQVELPDNWLENGSMWEVCRPDQTQEVRFGGYVERYEQNGVVKYRLKDYTTVQAVPYDVPTLGYDSNMVNMLRCWSAKATKTLDMPSFNRGEYTRAIEEKELAEVISKVLYPDDNHIEGKELRLKQQYFLSSASVQYAVEDFIKVYGRNFDIFPDKVALHVNDTHPGMAIPELMRILMDEEGLSWEKAEDITRRTFAYTNHTVMAEALEKWPEDMVSRLLPRIYMILQEINRRECAALWEYFPGQWERIGRMAVIGYGYVNMANLCVYMGHSVNGVSKIHTDILKKSVFHDFYLTEPSKFIAITNGITHRRWLMMANYRLSTLIDEAIGDAWRKDYEKLAELERFKDDAAFRQKFFEVKKANKERLSKRLTASQNTALRTDDMFDVQAKRLHEYKRQLLNALSILILYNRIKDNPDASANVQPRTYVFGAKAAPGYYRAKLIIRLINEIGRLVNNDPVASRYMKVVFVENYCVSVAEDLIPAADVSEQLSTAGKEASGTGNMKFMMNGAITLGTLDGANVEILDAVGSENIHIFGMTAEQVEAASMQPSRASAIFETNPEIRRVLTQLIDGTLCPEQPGLFRDIYHSLLFGEGSSFADQYFVLSDLPGYVRARENLVRDYADRDSWVRKAIVNVARSWIFASDRVIKEYNEKIWHLDEVRL